MSTESERIGEEENPLIEDSSVESPGILPIQQQVSGKKTTVKIVPDGSNHKEEDEEEEDVEVGNGRVTDSISAGTKTKTETKNIKIYDSPGTKSASSITKNTFPIQQDGEPIKGLSTSNTAISSGDHHRRTSDPMQKSARIGRMYRVSSQQKGFMPSPSYLPPDDNDAEIPKEEDQNVSWADVGRACCCHTMREWFSIFVGIASLLCCLYCFLLSLSLLGTSFKVVGGCTAGSMLGSDTNPVASLCIGIIATALLQSSSTTTSIVVSLVTSDSGNGLKVQQAIYIVMGANIGTSVTSMIVSLAHMSNEDEMERAFSGASLLLVFNTLTALILFPLELISNYLYEFTKVMLPTNVGKSEKWEGPVKKIVSPLADKIIIANKKLIEEIANGGTCEENYPVTCNGDVVNYQNCVEDGSVGLIGCDESTGKCPAFFQIGGTKDDDIVSGWVCLVISLFVLIVCLVVLVALLKKILLGASTRIIYKATNINGYLAMLIGAGVTVLVQSSSITASALTPLCGIGVLKVEQMFPLILGADIGTTITALLASMVSSNVEALQVALCHVFFNITGASIWYIVPFMRKLPLMIANYLGKITRKWRQFPILLISIMFFLIPLLLLGISACFEKKKKGFTALGVFLLLLMLGAAFYTWIWWRYKGGKQNFSAGVTRRKRRAAAIMGLADDMDYIKVDLEYCKNEIGALKDFAGLIVTESKKHHLVLRPPGIEQHVEPEEERFELPPEERLDDQISLHGSIQSSPWINVLKDAGESIKGSLNAMRL